MATIIPFEPRKRRITQQSAAREEAQILLFIGVRYERWSDESAARNQAGYEPPRQRPRPRNSRKRA